MILGPSGCGKSTLLRRSAASWRRSKARSASAGGDRRAGPRPHDGVPGVRAIDALEDRFPERAVPDEGDAANSPAPRRGRARNAAIEKVKLTEVPRRLSAHALGRHEDARRDRARDGARARHPADGRAVRRARRADPPGDAAGAAGAVGSAALHRAVRHPFDRGGDPGRLAHSGDVAASGTRARRARCRRLRFRQYRPARIRRVSKRIHGLLFGDGQKQAASA